jgi:hypothetical protein
MRSRFVAMLRKIATSYPIHPRSPVDMIVVIHT